MSRQPVPDLQSWIQELKNAGELVEIDTWVDPDLELAEIHRRVIAGQGPALLFRKVKGSDFPVVSNLFGSAARVERAVCRDSGNLRRLLQILEGGMPPSPGSIWKRRSDLFDLWRGRVRNRSPRAALVLQNRIDPVGLEALPFTKSWPEDGGSFLTLGTVYTEHPQTRIHNLGLYRMQRYGADSTGMHWQIDKGGGFHHHVAESLGKPLPVSVWLGGPPALILSAIAPLPENLGELALAGWLSGSGLSVTRSGPFRFPCNAEFALLGHVRPGVRRGEGPFGDHYGYYSLVHDFPVFQVERIVHRNRAVMPVTVVGKPRQEDFYIGDFLQELLAPLFPFVMPGVRDLWSYGETGYHSLAAAVLEERYHRESMKHAFRILGEGQLSLTKFLIAVTDPVPLRDFKVLLRHVLERFQVETDFYVFANVSMDTLDYSGPVLNRGSKGLILASGEAVRRLPESFDHPLPEGITRAEVFCPGCLVIEPGLAALAGEEALTAIIRHPSLKDWPWVVLSDDARALAASTEHFLWAVFTRLDPARHIHTGRQEIRHHHLVHSGPLLLDARKRPEFPAELFPDPDTASLVTRRWKEYFPDREVTMGEPW